MPTTPTTAESPINVAAMDGGISVEEYAAQLERVQEMERQYRQLEAKNERLKDGLAELEQEARERRARHVEKLGSWEDFAMLVAAVALAALASLVVDRRRRTSRTSRTSASGLRLVRHSAPDPMQLLRGNEASSRAGAACRHLRGLHLQHPRGHRRTRGSEPFAPTSG